MIRIIVDSSTLYTIEEGKKLNIDVVPLSVTINNQTYREYEEINADEFYQLIKQGHIPTSSQPPIGEFVELFEKYKDDQILVISMADGLSGTYQSVVGAQQISNQTNIVVINSKTLCVPHRIMVNEAIRMRDEGHSFEEIVEMVKEKVETTESFLLPQDFNFLKRGGRLTTVAATLSGLLKLQPVVTQTTDGTRLDRFTVGRNFNSAIKKIMNHFADRGLDDRYHFCVSHAFVPQQAQKVAKMMKERFNLAKVEIEELSCAFITQGGPLCLAIQVIAK